MRWKCAATDSVMISAPNFKTMSSAASLALSWANTVSRRYGGSQLVSGMTRPKMSGRQVGGSLGNVSDAQLRGGREDAESK
jgi:hypothetical protein